jgi:hypothetical protein
MIPPMNTATNAAETIDTIEAAALAAGCNVFFGRGSASRLLGHASFYGDLVAVLRALAILGVSRTNRRVVTGGWQTMTRWDLSDVDGEARGNIVSTKEGTSADLDYVLTRPMACMAA